MSQQKINFRQERDLGSVLGDAIKFIKQNFKPFFLSIILIVGPFLLLMSILYAYVQENMLSYYKPNPATPFGLFNQDYFLSIAFMVIGGFIVNILLSGVTYNYLCLYNEKPFGEKITTSEVARRLWDNIGRLIISAVTFMLTIIFILFVIAVICIGGLSGLGIAGGVIIGILIFFAAIIFLPVFMYLVPASFYLVVRDNVFIFTAIGTVRKFLSGNFWWTWLMMIVTLMAVGILQGIFNLPATIISMLKMFRLGQASESGNSLLLIVFYTLGMFLTYCTSSISHIITAFNFMSHEEKHEGKGLQAKIEEII